MAGDSPKTPRRAAGAISRAESLAYVAALLVNFVDQMGPQFTVPVLVPYGTWIGASLNTIALFTTVRGLASVVSNLWMPKLSDAINSRKWVALLSLVGCGLGYGIQGSAYRFGTGPNAGTTPSIVFAIGRFTTGFFSGMMPVLNAYVTELSQPDMALLTQRLITLQMAAQVAGMALAPISGSLATFGLQLPFYVCSGMGVGAIFFVLIFFQEVSVIKGLTAPPPPAPSATDLEKPLTQSEESDIAQVGPEATEGVGIQSASFAARSSLEKTGSPLCDGVIMLLFFAYMAVFVTISGGTTFLMPVMFRDDKFGIDHGFPPSESEFQGNIAKAVGLVAIPTGSVQVCCAIFLFLPLTSRLGELPVIVFFGALVCFVFPLYALVWEVWHVAVLNGIVGACYGFVVPALSPLCARYSTVAFPKQMAMAQGIPLIGLQLSNAFSQNVMAALVPAGDNPNLIIPWCVCGVCAAAFTVFFVICYLKAEAYLKPRDDVSVDKKEVQADGDVSAFVEECCAQVRQDLMSNQEILWNKHIQFVIQQNLSNSIPQVASWNGETNGKEHLEDTFQLLEPFPGEQAKFQRRFPHIGSVPHGIGAMVLTNQTGFAPAPAMRRTKSGLGRTASTGSPLPNRRAVTMS